jgi:hypothetical protein
MGGGGKEESERWEEIKISNQPLAMSPTLPTPHPKKNFDLIQTGCLEFSWREKLTYLT